MITKQILQTFLDKLSLISECPFAVYDRKGELLAESGNKIDLKEGAVASFAEEKDGEKTADGASFFKVRDGEELAYVLVAGGKKSDLRVGRMAGFQLAEMLGVYKERSDTDSFIKNLLLDNLLLVDIYNRAKKLRIPVEARRVVLILECSPRSEAGTLENIRQRIGAGEGDFVTAVDENSIIIVKTLEAKEDYREVAAIADGILDAVGRDPEGGTHIAYGTIVRELKEVSRSYKEARLALDVGKIFFDGRDNIAYSELGIGRLIYQLPIPLCKMFIREIFEDRSPDDFDEDTLTTISKFFENNLNVSETSRQLYIHRNTLVYRLDKLQKSTGLDLRVFEDAITFKIALMVVKYMKYMETLEY